MTTTVLVLGCIVGYFAIGSIFVRRVLPRIGRKLWRERIDYVRRYYGHEFEFYLKSETTREKVRWSIIGYAWVLAVAWPLIPFFFIGRGWWNFVHGGFLAAFERNNPTNMDDVTRQTVYHISPAKKYG